MKDFRSSVDIAQMRRIKYGTTPQQRMNWLQDAMEFVNEIRKKRKNWDK